VSVSLWVCLSRKKTTKQISVLFGDPAAFVVFILPPLCIYLQAPVVLQTLMYRVEPAYLFTIDGNGWLSAVDTLTQDAYTLAVVAYSRGDLIDTSLVVVHVQLEPAASTSVGHNCTELVAIVAAVCGVVLLILLAIVIAIVVKCRR